MQPPNFLQAKQSSTIFFASAFHNAVLSSSLLNSLSSILDIMYEDSNYSSI